MNTITAPAWTIEGNSDIHGASRETGKAVVCERCDAKLYAEVWYVKETATGKVWGVGSGCVKTLTGSSVSRLRQDQDAYAGAMAAEEQERGRARRFAAWAEINHVELTFLDEHLARIQAAQDRWFAANPNPGIGACAPPSAEFYERLRTKALKVGAWTEGEMQAVRREMSLDHNAALPTVKSRDIYEGTLERVRVDQDGFSRTPLWISTLTIRSADGKLLYFVKVRENSAIEADLFAYATKQGWAGHYATSGRFVDAGEAKRSNAFNSLVGKPIRFKGTVKGSAMTGGKVYFTRAALA